MLSATAKEDGTREIAEVYAKHHSKLKKTRDIFHQHFVDFQIGWLEHFPTDQIKAELERRTTSNTTAGQKLLSTSGEPAKKC